MSTDPTPIDEILYAAIQFPTDAERSVYLDKMCGDSRELRHDLDELLSSHFEAEGFMDKPAAEYISTADLSHEATIGKQIGPFTLLKQLGRGAMGVVYEAEEVSLGRRLALKILPFAALLNETQLERFATEATAAARLQHDNIVTVYSVGCERGIHFIAMQLIEGPSLSQVITELRHERHSDDEQKDSAETAVAKKADVLTRDDDGGHYHTVARIGKEAADALQYAHDNGVLHRDIKPSNLLLDNSGHVWIADFGLARIEDESQLTRTGDILGTLRYMSPEQATGERVDTRSDVYGLGATLYELATLQPVYDAEDRRDVIKQVLAGNPIAPHKIDRRIPRPLSLVISKSMARLDERYQSAEELADDLRRYLDGEPVLARPPSPLRRARATLLRHPIITLSSTALLIVACLYIPNVLQRFGTTESENSSVTSSTDTRDPTMFRSAPRKRTSRKNERIRQLRHEQLEDRRLLTTFDFPSFPDSTGLNLVGDASIAENALRLTSDTYQTSAAWYSVLQLSSVDFTTTFDFRLTDSHGEIAFVIQNERPDSIGGSGSNIGYAKIANSLAVEFDGHWNNDAFAQDPSNSHVSVHTLGVVPNSANEAFSLGWVDLSPEVMMGDGQVHTAKISYNAGAESLTVHLDATQVLEVTVDLADTLALDQGRAWMGFTSTSWQLPGHHDILNWEFSSRSETTPVITIDDVEQMESTDGTSVDFVFTVTRIGPVADELWVEVATTDTGTADVGQDYDAKSETLHFPAGTAAQTFTVTVHDDGDREGREYFDVSIVSAPGALIGDGQGRGSIIDGTPGSVFELGNLLNGDGSAGFVVSENVAGDFVGDVNGDGFDDLAFSNSSANAGAGAVHILYGAADGFPNELDLGTLNGDNGFVMNGDAGDATDWTSSAGDINGDGIGDLMVRTGGDFLKWYIVHGSSSGYPASFDLSSLDGSNGFEVVGTELLATAAAVGDVNGDGIDDIAIDSPWSDDVRGRTYVVFGKANGFPASFDIESLLLENGGDGTEGVVIKGTSPWDWTGWPAPAGDVNGDGFDDMTISGPLADSNGVDSGTCYLVFGKSSFGPELDLSSLDGVNGFAFQGLTAGDRTARNSAFGDINGDHFDDLIIASLAGDSFVVFGKASGYAPTLVLSSLDGSNGFVVSAIDESDLLRGAFLSAAADINGDGLDDLVVGAHNAEPNGIRSAGETYVVYGRTSGFPAELPLTSIDGENGYVLHGSEAYGRSGLPTLGGDVNGDGCDDLLVKGWFGYPYGPTKNYVVFGSDRTGAVTNPGTASDDILIGDSTNNVMVGGQANDTLIGNGGADVLRGGEGDDVLAVADTDFFRLVGGYGTDTLSLDGAGITLDLTTIPDKRIMGIEEIDITGLGDNTLTLDLLEVLNISNTSNILTVRSTDTDVVNLGLGWTDDGTQSVEGETFHVYTQGAAIVRSTSPATFIPTTEYPSTDTPISLQDAKNAARPGVTTSTIPDVSGLGSILDLNVTVDISHTYVGQLSARLIAPDGTPVELFSGVGGSGDNFTATEFDDEAAVPITSGEAPFTGTFRPVGSLAALDGVFANGEWKLEISDNVKGVTGTLNSWALDIAALPAGNTPPVAVDDDYSTNVDEGLTVAEPGVLDNDSDADGDAVTADPISNGATTQGGQVTLNSDGSFTYTPNAGFVGDDTFTYTVNDGKGGTNTGTVTINVTDASAATPIYVYDIRFESKRGNKDWCAVFEIRSDSNDSGGGDAGDSPVAGVEIHVTFNGQTLTGYTDSDGIFRTAWQRNLASGTYQANVTYLDLDGYAWITAWDMGEEDEDDDGVADNILDI